MAHIDRFRDRYRAERGHRVFHPSIIIDDEGLKLGRATIAKLSSLDCGLNGSQTDAERTIALLSIAYLAAVSPRVMKHAARAGEYWRQGHAALAHIELAFACLPPIETEDAFRLFLGEILLEAGLTPAELTKAISIDTDFTKYSSDQPRVPAGSGRASGRWGSSASSNSIQFAEASLAIGRTLLTESSPSIIRALAIFASRFAVPTAVLGALFIPTPNSGGVTEGTLPDAPDIRYRRDGPAGTLRLTQTDKDGRELMVTAQNQRGVLVDVETGAPIGRDFGQQLYLDLATVNAALTPRDRERQVAVPDEPQLCPAPIPDAPHDSKEHTLDYEDDVQRRVNPLLPLPRGFAVAIVDPITGEIQYPDDCFRYAGDLVDGNIRRGDFADAKGQEYSRLLSIPGVAEQVMAKIVEVTERHLRAAEARGARLKVYFAERKAADMVRERFMNTPRLRDVVVGYLPPSKLKSGGRGR